MRDLDADTISDYVAKEFDLPHTPRPSQLLTLLVKSAHDYIRESGLTHSELRSLLQFFRRVGETTSAKRDEFTLLSDVMGVSSLVDILADTRNPGVTTASPLGPYYLPNSPVVEQGGALCRQNEPGLPTILLGRVTDTEGAAIEGALLDIWHNAESGLYSNEDAAQDDMNNRGKIYTDLQGQFQIKTIRPRPYTIPMDGPVGDLMSAFGRSPWRSAHFHVIVSAKGYDSVISELFFSDCQYIDKDAVAAVRRSLIHEPMYRKTERGNTLIVEHHFCLQRTAERDGAVL
ncbi:MAG: dioxygenase [Porticoccaceae bacterium]|nr:dioxygenase [Porticoccaceae bacterium]